MQTIDPIRLKQEFVLRAKDRVRKDNEHAQNRDRDRREHRKSKETQDDIDDLMQVVVLATKSDVAQFQSRLDNYEQQAVQRILDLQQQRDQKLAEREAILDGAYELKDGTRVFVKDEQIVVDEHGNEIDADIITPDQIGVGFSTWDGLSGVDAELEDIDDSLSEVITFRDKIEELHNRSDIEGLTQDEFDELTSELDDIVPQSFKHENAAPITRTEAAQNIGNVDLGGVGSDMGQFNTIKLPGQH